LSAHLRESGLPGELLNSHKNLFAESPVFLWQGHVQKIQQLVNAIDEVADNTAYQKTVLANSPDIARHHPGPRGVFFGYDFHLSQQGPRLIEVNTNAGGSLLNLYLAAAQQACCAGVAKFFDGQHGFPEAEKNIVNMFREEWRLQNPGKALDSIAIIDNDPVNQFLYPEFLLFQSLFKRHGITALIADPGELAIRNNSLWLGNEKIDLVYNRLTDFYLQQQESVTLRDAYLQDLAVVTPSPRHYAIYADKHNLPVFSNTEQLREMGISEKTLTVLNASLPATVAVAGGNADELWNNRKQYFFKPATGYGSRGAYRGAKLTRKVWDNIINGDYIAQEIIPPSERQLVINGEKQALKLDIRAVTYHGNIQQLSARLYQGQTTNLRTEGGGLATVFSTPEVECC